MRICPKLRQVTITNAAWAVNLVIDGKICLECLEANGTSRFTIYDPEGHRYCCPGCGLESDIVDILPELKENPTEQEKEFAQSNRRKPQIKI